MKFDAEPGLKFHSDHAFASSTYYLPTPGSLVYFFRIHSCLGAKTMASPIAAIFNATIIWLASFVILPLPMAPTSFTEAP